MIDDHSFVDFFPDSGSMMEWRDRRVVTLVTGIKWDCVKSRGEVVVGGVVLDVRRPTDCVPSSGAVKRLVRTRSNVHTMLTLIN